MRGVLVAALLLSAPAARADEADWSRSDLVLEGIYVAAHVADWMQTAQLSKWGGGWYTPTPGGVESYRRPAEGNPLLGPTPSLRTVNIYFAATLIGHAAVTAALPPRYRRWWQGVTIGVELAVLSRNAAKGVHLTVPW